MFPDARVAPVHKDGSFTLVSSGLKDHLEDKLYNSMRTGAEFKIEQSTLAPSSFFLTTPPPCC